VGQGRSESTISGQKSTVLGPKRLDRGWTFNSGGVKKFLFSTSVQSGCGTHLASYPMVARALFRMKSVDHPTPSSTEVKERVKLYIYFPCVCIACYGQTFTFTWAIKWSDC